MNHEREGLPPDIPTIAIDPGVQGTGIAVWAHGEVCSTHVIKPKSGTWEARLVHVLNGLELFIDLHMKKWVRRNIYPTNFNVFIEQPAYFESFKGQTSARRGDLAKLTLIAGSIYGLFWGRKFVNVFWLPIGNWKGQLSKEQVDRRIMKILGKQYPEHASDAVGMALYLNGYEI